MTDVRVDVIPDSSATDGGRAIIRLSGVYDLPIDATYRIEPLDEGISADADPGWPSGDRKPNGSHLGHDGIELIIGPDVVEARRLAPGTPVLLTIPSVAIRARVRWPDIPQRQSRSQIKLLPPPPPLPINNPEPSHDDPAPVDDRPDLDPGLSDLTFAQDSSPDSHHEPGTDEPGPDEPDTHTDDSAQFGSDRLPPGIDPTVDRDRPDTSREPAGEPPNEPSIEPSDTRRIDPPEELPRRLNPTPDMPRYLPRPDLVRPFLLGVLLAGMVGFTGWLAFQNEISRYVRNVAQSRLAQVGTIAPVGPSAAATLNKIIGAPAVAPPDGPNSGDPNSGASVNTALERANDRLQRQPPDRAEARFWLRKAVGMSLSSKEMTWALTQLGTLYAVDGASQTDYARARLLWELASAQGDPVALCFLGALHEKGLGGTADVDRAKALFARAKALGGCKGAENPLGRPLPRTP